MSRRPSYSARKGEWWLNRLKASIRRLLPGEARGNGVLPERTLFVLKNGLSALLMRALWSSSGIPVFYYAFNDDPDHKADVERILAPIKSHTRRISLDISSAETRDFLSAPPASFALVHTLSNNKTVSPLRKALPSGVPRYVVHHGTVELEAYVGNCMKGISDGSSGYYLLFRDEVERYLQASGIPMSLPAFRYPDNLLIDSATSLSAPAGGVVTNTLFAMQYLIDSNVLSDADLRRCINGFLDRRPPMHYRIKLHPRPCQKTLQVMTEVLVTRKLTYDVLPADSGIIETSFPEFACQEISTFYSTAAPICHKIYGIPFDTMLPELVQCEIMIPVQRLLTDFLYELLYSKHVRFAHEGPIS
jgi:hypothetical protein